MTATPSPLNNSLNSSKPELQVSRDYAPWSSIAERRENVVYGVVRVEAGEEEFGQTSRGARRR